jgi:hypothetical protein
VRRLCGLEEPTRRDFDVDGAGWLMHQRITI